MNSLIVPKNLKEGTFWDCEISIMLQNILKIEGGPFGDKKIEKKSHSAEKTQRGDPIVSSGFVSYDKNGVTERGTFCTILNALPVCRSSSLVVN